MILPFLMAATLMSPPPLELKLAETWAAPHDIPVARVHGWVRLRNQTYVGGLGGLYHGRAGAWETLDERPVRGIAVQDRMVWVLFGDGSVDKLDPTTNRLYFDVMKGSARRPWVSCLGLSGARLLFGGHGGWIERSESLRETYPKEMEGDVVTSILQAPSSILIGTQRKGLFRFRQGELKRFGFAAGLPDSWVTSLAWIDGQCVVGLAEGGVVAGVESFRTVAQPIQKVRKLVRFRGKLVVAGMDGCWTEGQRLTDEEVTCLVVDGDRLGIGTPTGMTWWK